jgi:hypothetical protein
MRNRIICGLVLTAMGMSVYTALATRFAFSEPLFRQYFSAVAFGPEANSMGTVRCPVTLEGSYHSRTISKVAESLLGYIMRALLASSQCTGGSGSVFATTLPWHVRYYSFNGTLPLILTIRTRIVGARFRINDGFVCTITTTPSEPIVGILQLESGSARVLNLESGPEIFTGIECQFIRTKITGASEVFAGTSGTARITVTLVQ